MSQNLSKSQLLPALRFCSGLLLGAACAWGMPSLAFGADNSQATLLVGVQSGFRPALEQLLPTLTQKTGMQFQILDSNSSELYKRIESGHSGLDLIIANNDGSLNVYEDRKLIEKGSIVPIVSSQVVLWCPSEKVTMRVSILDTLMNAPEITLGIPGPLTPSMRGVKDILDKLPKSIKIINAKNHLESWRLAYRQQVDCAVTMKSMMGSSNGLNFRNFPKNLVQITAVTPVDSKHPDKAREISQLLISPMMRGRLQNAGFQ